MIKVNLNIKVFLPVLILQMIIAAIIFILLGIGTKNSIKNDTRKIGESIVKKIERNIQSLSYRAVEAAIVYSELEDVKEAYKFDDISNTKKYLKEKLQFKIINLKKYTDRGNKLRIHFNKYPAVSLWRTWRKDSMRNIDEDISSYRKTISKLNESKQPLRAVEVGKGGLGIRGIAPIFNEEKIKGSVEFIYSFNDLITKLNLNNKEELNIFLDQRTVPFTWEIQNKQKFGNYSLTVKSRQNKIDSFITQNLLLNGKDSLYQEVSGNKCYSVFPIKDYNRKVVAIACYTYNISYIKLQSNQVRNKAIIISSISFILILLLVLFLMNKAIIKPIKNIKKDLIAIADGNLTKKISFRSNDDIGEFVNQLNDTFKKIADIIIFSANIFKSVKQAGEHLNKTSQEVSQGASEQAASVEEVSASMQQMSANIEQNVENAKTTEKEVYMASAAVYEGNKSVTQTAELMELIKEKLEIINDIAKQTNILALNASVEAASAGEFGSGFAVIAREIRALSETSNLAAVEIQSAIATGVQVSEKASSQLSEIVKKMEDSSEAIKSIVVSSKEQKNGVNQVLGGVEQLNNITQKNAAVSEEMASSADTLAGQADMLSKSINYFNLEEKDDELFKQQMQKNSEIETIKEEKIDFIDYDEEDDTDNGYEEFKEGYPIELGDEKQDDDFEMF